MKQKAKTVVAETVSEYVHFVSVTDVFHPLETTGWPECLKPDGLLERVGE